MENEVDLVLPWVDGNDKQWWEEKKIYAKNSLGDSRMIRYRDWDNLRYLFRGIEQFLPWIRTVHFITWGHLPQWVNRNCPKLHIVKHADYIPEKYLPTFSSHPIELNLHRIEGLADRFVYANDDTFFIKETRPECFFKQGLPVDCAIQNVLQFHRRDGIDRIVANDLECVNRNFNKREVIGANRGKWFSAKYGKGTLQNLYLQYFSNFTGFVDPHIPYPYLKKTWEKVWEKEPEMLDATCRAKVRANGDVNQWLCRYWQFAEGNFMPGDPSFGKLYVIGKDDQAIEDEILHQRHPVICLSDDDESLDFEKEKAFINRAFERLLPEKSNFER